MERFYAYSMERQRAIRLMWQEDDGSLRQANAQITAWDGRQLSFTTLRPKGQWTLRAEQVLSADYKKGDDGSTD